MNGLVILVLVLALAASAFYTGYWVGRSTPLDGGTESRRELEMKISADWPVDRNGNYIGKGTEIGQRGQPASADQIPEEAFAVAGRQRPATWRERRRELEAKQRTKREQREQWRG